MYDSNMSDSQYMRFQNKLQKKMEKYTDDFDNENRIKLMKKRFEFSKRRRKTMWEKVKSFLGIMILVPAIGTTAVIGKEPTRATLNPISNFRMVTSGWEDNVFTYGTDLSKYQNKEVENIEIVFSKDYSGEKSIVLMKAFFPVEIVESYVLMGDKCPEDELKVFKDGEEILDFRNSINVADDKFDVKILVSNRKHRIYSEVSFKDVKVVGIVHRKK